MKLNRELNEIQSRVETLNLKIASGDGEIFETFQKIGPPSSNDLQILDLLRW